MGGSRVEGEENDRILYVREEWLYKVFFGILGLGLGDNIVKSLLCFGDRSLF